MNHLSEERLVQHYYKDTEGREERAAHLATCLACREAFGRLENTLNLISEEPVPERSEQYGTEVWNRIRAHLPERDKRSWFGRIPTARWVTAGALAALVIAAFFLGRISKPVPPNTAVNEGAKEKKVLLVALGDHLDRSQMVLVELTNAPTTGDVDISSEQQRAEELIAANRLYRQVAARTGDTDLAAVLDDLERVLVEVAHEPDKVDGEQMREIRERIESKGILFKVRVIGSKVRQDERPEKQDAPTSQGVPRQTT